MDELVWSPDERAAETTRMGLFLSQAAATADRAINSYEALYRWSIDEPAEFWQLLAAHCGVRFTKPPEQIFRPGTHMRDARWFVGAELNFAENLLAGDAHDGALIFRDERGRRRELSRAELRGQVAGLAAGLRDAGVCSGDRVAAVLPNCPEAVIVALASASIGAVFTSCSPDFGAAAILDRLGQTQPKILFVCDGYSYNGKRIDCTGVLTKVAAQLPSLLRTITIPFLRDDSLDAEDSFGGIFVSGAKPDYAQLPFDHPLYILYSSGTTGKPKCIVHGAGGTLLQHMKELQLHTDLGPGDTLFYYTSCGWMMWNWLISALGAGASVVLYDGSPFHPDENVLPQLAVEEGVSVFGTSPRYLAALEKSGSQLSAARTIRCILSTGAPLGPAAYDYVQTLFDGRVQLASISGGTDIISCFALGNPLLPVYRGELQCRGLGMAVDVFDDSGQSLREQPGELVCTRPFPSMPISFWNDTDGTNYQAAYFERFPDVWAHGDMAEITAHGGIVIYGRSDAVLNPGGVRIGTAEVCGPALSLPELADCIAIGQRYRDDTRIILFVVLQAATPFNDELVDRIRSVIREAASPRHVPAKIIAVPDIPRTISGKPMELAVRAAVQGDTIPNLEAVANPEALEFFRNCPELD